MTFIVVVVIYLLLLRLPLPLPRALPLRFCEIPFHLIQQGWQRIFQCGSLRAIAEGQSVQRLTPK